METAPVSPSSQSRTVGTVGNIRRGSRLTDRPFSDSPGASRRHSRFTKEAREASYKKGAITILLLDGEAIAELMIERGIGVVRQPVYLYEIASEFFDFDKTEE